MTLTIRVAALFLCLTLACSAMLACRSTTTPREGYLVGSSGVRIFYRVVGNGPDTIVTIHGGPGGDMDNIAPDLGRLGTRHSFGPVLAARYAQAYPDHVARMIFAGAIGPRRADAGSYGRSMYARMQPATRDSVIALVQALVTGMAPDPVATCLAYEQLLKQAAFVQGDSTKQKGSSCTAPSEAVEYANRYTSQITFASLGEWDYTGALRRVSAPLLVVYGDRDPRLSPANGIGRRRYHMVAC